MAQFDFYAAPGDREYLFRVLFGSADLEIIPDLRYKRRSAPAFRQPGAKFARAVTQTLHLFFRGAFSKYPLRFVKEDGGMYSIDPDRSGAMLDISIPGVEPTAEGLLLRPGNLYHPRQLWDPTLSFCRRVPEPMKEAFQRLVASLKSSCLTRRKIHKHLWIGRQAWELLTAGKAKILVLGKWWAYRDGKLRLDHRTGF